MLYILDASCYLDLFQLWRIPFQVFSLKKLKIWNSSFTALLIYFFCIMLFEFRWLILLLFILSWATNWSNLELLKLELGILENSLASYLLKEKTWQKRRTNLLDSLQKEKIFKRVKLIEYEMWGVYQKIRRIVNYPGGKCFSSFFIDLS